MADNFVWGTGNGTLLTLRVSPGTKKSLVEGAYGHHAFKLKVAAPPVDGKANAEAERFLAGLFGLSRSEVSIVKGASGRDKVVLLKGVEPREVVRVIEGRIG